MSFSEFQSHSDKSDFSGDASGLSPEIINVGRFLARLLEQNDGKVSSDQVLREGPKFLSIDEATFRRMHDEIRKLNPNEQEALRHEFGIDIHYARRSWLTSERKNQEADQRAAAAAAEAAHAEETDISEIPEDEPKRSPNKQEEWRMSSYIMDYLSDLYSNGPFVPEDAEVAFDVCDQRRKIKGTTKSVWENIDVLAVDWRSPTAVGWAA